uniref:NADH dehydrogenase subunit 1 n=1 Tax=Paraponera clavata TaxID=55425 RepID=UPI002A7EDED7|nr:NADH dehydrogenase subunit 1 [Paraponera clavata]WNO15830.1 NADH dehydrogenase subunit 1 [Paraponera clavata]
MLCQFINYLYMNLLEVVITLLDVLVGLAFVTLLERKILSYVQDRKGPNKVGLMGIFQPFSDAIKLFSKENIIVMKSNYMMFYICPVFMFMLMLMVWLVYPFITNVYYMNYSILYMIMVMSLSSYLILFIGWSSNSLYSMVGAMRSVSQMLSYEVSFILIIFILMLLSESYSLYDFLKWQVYSWYMIMLLPIFIVFFISILAELNRSPMDFVEGESELVSGFNIEYFSGSFALIFMAEYGMIIFLSMMSVLMFTSLGSSYMSCLMINLMVIMVIFMRGMLPRMRYDHLMYLCWKIVLPMVLSYLILIYSFKFYMVLMIYKLMENF